MTDMQDGEVLLCGSVQYECNDVVTAVCSDTSNGLVWLGLRSGIVRAMDAATSEVVCEIPLRDDSSSDGGKVPNRAGHEPPSSTEVRFLVRLAVAVDTEDPIGSSSSWPSLERRSDAAIVGAAGGGLLFIVRRWVDADGKGRWVARSVPSDRGTLPLCAVDVTEVVGPAFLQAPSVLYPTQEEERLVANARGKGAEHTIEDVATRAPLPQRSAGPTVAFAVGYDNGAVVIWAETRPGGGQQSAEAEFRASRVYVRPSATISSSCTAVALLRRSLASDNTSGTSGPALVAAYSGGGVIAFWSLGGLRARDDTLDKDGSLMYTTAPLLPTDAEVSVLAIAPSAHGLSPTHIWVGSTRGDLAVLDAESGDVLRSSSRLYDRRVVCVTSFGDGYVWSAAEDGRATVWDTCSATLTAVYELLHPSTIVGCVLATQSLVRRVHLVGADAFAQVYASQCSIPGDAALDDTSARVVEQRQEALGRMLDDCMHRARHWQEEARRSTLAKLDAHARERHNVSAAEQQQRGIILHVWADATEAMFVGFLLAAKALRGLSAEADALRAERDYFQAMIASMSAAQQARPSLSSPISRPVVSTTSTHTSPIHTPPRQLHASPPKGTVAALVEKDAQIRMLQTELLHLRCECDARSEHQERERVREAATLRSLAHEQARHVQQARDELLVKDAVLKDCRQELSTARSECKSLSEEVRELRLQVGLRDAALERKQSDITALQVELNEIRLDVQMTTAREDSEKSRLQRDLDAMRAPWAAMKQSLHDARTEVDMIKHQCAMRIDQLQAKLAQKDREMAALRRTSTIR